MITRIMKLPLHDNVLIGRDLANIFKNGYVYEIKEFDGEHIITCLGESALFSDASQGYPNQHSKINEIMRTGVYMMTKDEFGKIYHEDREYDDELPLPELF